MLYQVYPRSFQDSDADGLGDLAGGDASPRPSRMAGDRRHLAEPGASESPGADGGYDVADYRRRGDPELGRPRRRSRSLIDAASSRGIRVMLDLVPNHTSERHPWFVDARRGRDAECRDRYVWADPAPDGGPPNNWVSVVRRSAWTLEEHLGSVLPPQLPARAAGPELVERGCP